MRYVHRGFWLGTILGVVVTFIDLPILAKDPCFNVQIGDRQSNWNENFYVDCKIVPSSNDQSVAPMMHQDNVRLRLKNNAYCLKHYDMSADNVKKLLSTSYDYIVIKLLTLNLSDDAIKELWSVYRHKRCIYEDNKQECEKELLRGLQDRAKQQEQKKLLELYRQQKITKQKEQESGLCHSCSGQVSKKQHELVHDVVLLEHVVSDELQDVRDQALQESELTNYQQYEQCYELDKSVQAYLHENNIDCKSYEQFIGTALQHQYHHEACTLLQQSVQVMNVVEYFFSSSLISSLSCLCPTSSSSGLTRGSIQHLWLQRAAQCAVASHESNQKGWLNVTQTLLNAGYTCFSIAKDVIYERPGEYAQAVVSGVYKSVTDFVHCTLHPLQTLQGLGQAIYFVLETAALQQAAADLNSDKIQQKYKQREGQIYQALGQLQEHIVTMDGPELMQAVTKIGSDFFLTPRIIHACAHLLGGAVSQAHKLRKVEVGEQITQAAQELELATEQSVGKQVLAEFMEAEKGVSKAAQVQRPFLQVLQDLKQYGAATKVAQREVKIHFDNQFYKNELMKFYKQVQGKYANFKIQHEGQQINLICNLEHIMSYNLKFRPNKETGLLEGFISGGHVGTYTDTLKQAGKIQVIFEEVLPTGVRVLEYKHVFGLQIAQKTEYPLSWTADKIMQATIEIVQNFSKETVLHNGMIARQGISNGVEIVVVFKKQSATQYKLITAFPYYEKFMRF